MPLETPSRLWTLGLALLFLAVVPFLAGTVVTKKAQVTNWVVGVDTIYTKAYPAIKSFGTMGAGQTMLQLITIISAITLTSSATALAGAGFISLFGLETAQAILVYIVLFVLFFVMFTAIAGDFNLHFWEKENNIDFTNNTQQQENGGASNATVTLY